MSVRREEGGQARITADDLQFTHRGRTFGVELSSFPGLNICTLMEFIDGAWTYPRYGSTGNLNINLDMDEAPTVNDIGGPRMWITNVFFPWLNRLLTAIYPAVEVGQSPIAPSLPTTASPIDQVDALLSTMIAFSPQPDGTLRATLR